MGGVAIGFPVVPVPIFSPHGVFLPFAFYPFHHNSIQSQLKQPPPPTNPKSCCCQVPPFCLTRVFQIPDQMDSKAQFAPLRIPLPRFQSSQMLTWEGPMKKQRPPPKVTLLVPPGGVDLASRWAPWHWKEALDVLSKDGEVGLQARAPFFRRRGRAGEGETFPLLRKGASAPFLPFARPPLPPSRPPATSTQSI